MGGGDLVPSMPANSAANIFLLVEFEEKLASQYAEEP